MTRKVLVLGEIRDGALRKVSFEAIAAAKNVAGGGEVVALVMGKEVGAVTQELIYYGADRVLKVEHDHLEYFTPQGFGQALLQVVDKEKPDGILFGHTAYGKDLAPKLAARLDAGLISDVTAIDVDNEKLIFTRPIYAGKAFEKKTPGEGMILATIRPNNVQALERDESRTGRIESADVSITDLQTIIKEVVRKTAQGIDLSEAKIVVSGGRGVKGVEGFQLLKELADVLGGAVGASRGACDAEYCDYSLQIGQTGKVVTPDLYVACGISGAIQHLAGMSNSKVIVAINKDPEATIFQVADYGIVGDLFEVIPMLTQEFKSMIAQNR